VGLKSAMSAHICSKNSELRFLSVIHNAGVGGSSPPVATIYFYRITHPLMQPSLGADSLLIDSYLKRVSLQFEAFVELTNANFKVPNPDTY